jgi:hypothetical protein
MSADVPVSRFVGAGAARRFGWPQAMRDDHWTRLRRLCGRHLGLGPYPHWQRARRSRSQRYKRGYVRPDLALDLWSCVLPPERCRGQPGAHLHPTRHRRLSERRPLVGALYRGIKRPHLMRFDARAISRAVARRGRDARPGSSSGPWGRGARPDPPHHHPLHGHQTHHRRPSCPLESPRWRVAFAGDAAVGSRAPDLFCSQTEECTCLEQGCARFSCLPPSRRSR